MAGSLEGLQTVQQNLRLAVLRITNRSMAGLMEGGLIIQRAAQEKCPVVTGNLRSSAYTELDTSGGGQAVEIGFTAAYAPFVHENPNAGKSGKKNPSKGKMRFSEVGEWKFLEHAIDEKGREVLARIARRAKV
jgi:hypothetical protein